MQGARYLNRNVLIFIFSFLALTFLAQTPAFSAPQTTRLVYLPGKDLEILYVGQKGQWCAERLDLVLLTSQPQILQNKELTGEQIVELITRLRRSCPAISRVGMTGFSRIDPDRPLVEGSYLAKDAWKFSKLKLPERFEPAQAPSPQIRTDNQTSTPAQITSEPNRRLSFQEAMELQQRLSFLGFSVGQIDGRPGRQTAVAISNFLAQYGLSLPVRADLNMLSAVRKISGADKQVTQPAPKLPRKIALSAYKDTGNRQLINLGRLFAFWTLRNTSGLLDNRDILLNWLYEEGRDNQSPMQARAFDLKRLYDRGTKFQKQDVLKTFRQLLESEVKRRDNGLSQPLALKIRLGAKISGDHQPGQGFPMSYRYNSGFGFSQRSYSGRNELNYKIGRLGRVLHLPLPRRTLVKHIPILDERKARIFAGLLQDQQRYDFEMRFYMTVKNINFLTVGGLELQAENSVDRMSLAMLDRNDLSGGSKLVHLWDLVSLENKQKAQAAARKPTALQFARWAGIKVLRGNLVLGGWKKHGRVDFTAIRNGKSRLTRVSKTGWAGFANLISLQRDLSLLENHEIAIAVANTFLSGPERIDLERGKNFLHAGQGPRNQQNFNEFEYREFLTRFERGDYASRVKQYFPPFPIPIVNIQPVTLGKYNFPNGSFPITFGQGKRNKNIATWKPVLNLNMHDKFNLQRYPKQLSLSPDNAKRLLALFKQRNKNSRTVYLAIYADLKSIGVTAKPGRYNVVAKRVALYLDRDLRDLLADFSLPELSAPERKATPTSVAISLSKLDRLYGLTPVNEDQLARVVEHFSVRKGFFGAYVRSMDAVQKVNELEKERVFNEFSETLRFVQRPVSYWMTGWGKLGIYDTTRAGFPIKVWDIGSTTSKISSVSAKFRTEIEDVKSVAFIKMERERAAALLEKYPSRHFLLRVKVTPFKTTWQFRNAEAVPDDPQDARYAEANIFARINEVYLLTDPNSDRKDEKALIAVKIYQKVDSMPNAEADDSEITPQ